MTQASAPRLPLLRIVAGIATVLVLATAAWMGYRAVVTQQIASVRYGGDAAKLAPAELEALALAIQKSEAPTLEAIREAARRVPWVRDATVRREFPDAVRIDFVVHEAFARWNEGQLVSVRGEVFTAETAEALPQLRGPDSAAARMVAEFPLLLALLAPIGSALVELRLSARGAWQAVLASGMTLDLGRADVHARAQRFAAAWPQVAALQPRHADLRHANGFALRRNPATQPAATPARKARTTP